MSLSVIKYVAGGGKTTNSIDFMKNNKNGIYLAFNNKVVNDISKKGFLSKTIDSFFDSFIIPKLALLLPIINKGASVKYIESADLPVTFKGVSNLKIGKDGKIYNRSSYTGFSLNTKHYDLMRHTYVPNLNLVKFVFSTDKIRLTNTLRSNIAYYLINTFPNQILKIIEDRFSFVIIDEAQDLKDYREEFAKLLSSSKLNFIVLGDEYQNIQGGGLWFKNLNATERKIQSFRCPEANCEWIRNNLGIEIKGSNKIGGVNSISLDSAISYDNSKRTLLYDSKRGQVKQIVEGWKGPVTTIKTAKGQTIDTDIVIIGKTMNLYNMYTAITRSTKSVYLTAELCKE